MTERHDEDERQQGENHSVDKGVTLSAKRTGRHPADLTSEEKLQLREEMRERASEYEHHKKKEH